MQRAKAFFFVCSGVLSLAFAYHFGATSATAQAPSNSVVGETNGVVVTANGDVYVIPAVDGSQWAGPRRHAGNVFVGSSPTSAKAESFASVKARYR